MLACILWYSFIKCEIDFPIGQRKNNRTLGYLRGIQVGYIFCFSSELEFLPVIVNAFYLAVSSSPVSPSFLSQRLMLSLTTFCVIISRIVLLPHSCLLSRECGISSVVKALIIATFPTSAPISKQKPLKMSQARGFFIPFSCAYCHS